MRRPSLLQAVAGAAAALGIAAAVNVVLAVGVGDRLVIPGELSPGTIGLYTFAAFVPAAVTLWRVPRYFPWIAIAVALLTVPFPLQEFGPAAGTWLAGMHLIAGVAAAWVAPRVAFRSHRTSAA